MSPSGSWTSPSPARPRLAATMHTTTPDHVFAIGAARFLSLRYDRRGLAARVVDVSDPASPVAPGDVALGSVGTFFNDDPRLFAWDVSRSRALLPVTQSGPKGAPSPVVWVVRVGSGGVPAEEAKAFAGDVPMRAIPLGDRLAVVTTSSVVVVDADSLTRVAAAGTAARSWPAYGA